MLLLTSTPAYADLFGEDAPPIGGPPPVGGPMDAGTVSSPPDASTSPAPDASGAPSDAGVSSDAGMIAQPDEPPELLGPCGGSLFDAAAGEGRLILTAAPGISASELRAFVELHGAEVTHEYSFGVAAELSAAAYASATGDPAWATLVDYSERDEIVCADSLPDLQIIETRVTPSNTRLGNVISVRVAVRNNGTQAAANFNVSIYRNQTTKPTTATPLGTNTNTILVNFLAGGATTVVEFFPSYGATGTKTLWALADSTSNIVESAEGNNASDAHTIIVTGPNSTALPDLIFTAFAPSTTNTVEDRNLTINVTVRNRGSGTAGTFYVSAYQNSAIPPSTFSQPDATAKVGSLAAGTSKTISLTINYPFAGQYSAWALADSFANADESNEANNVRGPAAINVRPQRDVAMGSCAPPIPYARPYVFAAGDQFDLEVGVSNRGITSVGAFEAAVFADLASAPTVSTPEDFTLAVPGLAAGAFWERDLLASYAVPGSYDLWCLADSDGQIVEEYEFNDYLGPTNFTILERQTIPTGIRRIRGQFSSASSGNETGEVNVVVGVIDTGINSAHPDLRVEASHGFGYPTGEDDNGHGTHVAGTIAARDNRFGVVGVAPGARLWALKSLNAQGQGLLSDTIAALDFVAANAGIVRVVNLSLNTASINNTFNAAVARAVNAGVSVVVSAGNGGIDASTVSPSSEPLAITVAALIDTDGQPGGLGGNTQGGFDDTYATFSNWGWGIDFVAPGWNIRSTGFLSEGTGDFGFYHDSGTSMAAPHVTGLVALLLNSNGQITTNAVRSAIQTASSESVSRTHGESRPSYPVVNADPL